MDGKLIPDGLGLLSPWYLNLFENVTTVQFDHRLVAYILCAAALANAAMAVLNRDRALSQPAMVLAGTALAQAGLGIATLLAVVPLWLGLAHQAGAAITLGVAVWNAHTVFRRAPDPATAVSRQHLQA
jgi:cytochrome c oxidase assembly protein subunit 15